MTATRILQASNLCFRFPEHTVFDNLNLDIPAGVTIVRGGDGRGKTSLLKCLAGKLKAQSGQLTINGIQLEQQAAAYRQQVYYVDPRTEEFDQLSVPDYLASVQAKYPGFDAARIPALLEGLSLLPHVEKKLFMLSTGSKRKVYLAGAFAAGAAVNLLDDPFAGLDRSAINFVSATLNARGSASTRPAQGPQAWIASFYEVPEQITAQMTVDLGD